MKTLVERRSGSIAALLSASVVLSLSAGPVLGDPAVVFPTEVISAPADPNPGGPGFDQVHFARYMSLDEDRALLVPSESSAAYIYRKGRDGWQYESRIALPADHASATAAALRGNVALVGSRSQQGTTSALVFKRGPGGWALIQTLPHGLNNTSGASIAADRDTVAIGENDAVGIYQRTSSGLQLQARLSAPEVGRSFGSALALEGQTLMVGSWQADNFHGAVYVYYRGSTGWQLAQQLSASDPQATFGYSLGFSGGIAVVGAYGADEDVNAPVPTVKGAAYVFVKQGGSWHQQQKLLNPTNGTFSYAVADTDGRRLFVGAFYIRAHDDDPLSSPTASKVFVYARRDGEWVTTRVLQPPAQSNNFALSHSIDACVFLTSDAYVSTPDPLFDGEGYVYDLGDHCR